jgi:hypothetical protein
MATRSPPTRRPPTSVTWLTSEGTAVLPPVIRRPIGEVEERGTEAWLEPPSMWRCAGPSERWRLGAEQALALAMQEAALRRLPLEAVGSDRRPGIRKSWGCARLAQHFVGLRGSAVASFAENAPRRGRCDVARQPAPRPPLDLRGHGQLTRRGHRRAGRGSRGSGAARRGCRSGSARGRFPRPGWLGGGSRRVVRAITSMFCKFQLHTLDDHSGVTRFTGRSLICRNQNRRHGPSLVRDRDQGAR